MASYGTVSRDFVGSSHYDDLDVESAEMAYRPKRRRSLSTSSRSALDFPMPASSHSKFLFACDYRRVYWDWWANTLFLVGSILYLVTGVMCWVAYDDYAFHCFVIEFSAAVCFLLDPLLYMVGWYTDRELARETERQRLLSRDDSADGMSLSPTTTEMEFCNHPKLVHALGKVDWSLLGHIFFMLGSIGYVSLACMGWWAYELEDEYWLLDKVSTGIFVVDSFLYVMAWLRLKLIAGNGPDQVFMFDFTQHWRRIDYSGWGDWLFVVGSGLYFVDSYVCHFFDDPDELLVCEKINFAAAILFVVDALLYWIALKVAENKPPPIHTTSAPSRYDDTPISAPPVL